MLPVFGPSSRLDIEAELGFVVGVGFEPGRADRGGGRSPPTSSACCLVNDWSARDIQPWEYVPLGPFVAKSFATSISGWITPLAALAAARVAPPPRTHPLLPYLADRGAVGAGSRRCGSTGTERMSDIRRLRELYWTGAQMLAQLTVGGASVRPGDLYASGTISGPEPGHRRLVHRTDPQRHRAGHAGRRLVAERSWPTATPSPSPATAPTATGFLSLGEVTGTVLPAR